MEFPIETPGGSPGNGWRKFATLLICSAIIFMVAVSGRAYLAMNSPDGAKAAVEESSREAAATTQFVDEDGQTKELGSPAAAITTPTIPPNQEEKKEEQGLGIGDLWRSLWPSPSPSVPPSLKWDGTPEGCRKIGGIYIKPVLGRISAACDHPKAAK